MINVLACYLRRLLLGIAGLGLFAACGLPHSSMAQVTANVEPFSLGQQEPGWDAQVGADFKMEANETVLLSIDLSPRIDYVRGANSVTVVGEAGFTERAGTTVRNKFLLHSRYLRELGLGVRGEVFTRILRDEFSLVNSRFSVGIGPRFEIVNTEETATYAGIQGGFQSERLDLDASAEHPRTLDDARAFGYLAYRQQITDNTTLLNTLRTGVRLAGDLDDVRLTNSATMEVEVSENVSLNASFDVQLDSDPPGDQPDVSMSITNGLTVSL